jgi:trehalose 6-phosphate synthase
MPGRLVVVSNRVSVPSARGAAGGLAVGLKAALRERGGLWFGWSGEHGEQEEPRLIEQGKITYALLDLTDREYEGYYAGFANRALWPICHYRIDLASFDADDYATYKRVNERFAKALLPLLRPEDRIWVHDYHLLPLGAALRRQGARQRLGFFLHIPFPAAQVFATLPCHEELGRALCEYDVIGLHGRTDAEQCADYLVRELRADPLGGNRYRYGTREFELLTCPIGIEPKEVVKLLRSAEGKRQAQALESALGSRKLIIGADRLDYTKGIPQRLRAFEQLLVQHESHRRQVALMQISAPSREEVPEYQNMRRSIERLVGHINGRFGEHDWVPVRYMNRTYSRGVLANFLARAQIGLITPLRDGLNLVAEEFVVTQPEDNPGVLVLSRFAGAAELLEGALIVNPYDTGGMAAALNRALLMPREERQDRYRTMLTAIRANDITAWRRRFLGALESVALKEAA